MPENMRVVVCEPGKDAEVREIAKSLEAMQALVGGYIGCVRVLGGYDCWVNDDGRRLGLEANRLVSATAIVSRQPLDLPKPFDYVLRPGTGDRTWDLVGTFFIAKSTPDGDTIGLDEDEADMLAKLFTGTTPVCRPLLPEEVRPPGFTVTVIE